MDTEIKQKALADAIKLTGEALASTTGNNDHVAHGDNAAAFLETVYRKLAELYADAVNGD